MSGWRTRLSYGARKDVGEVRLTNGIIQSDAFSPLLFVLLDPLIKVIKRRVGGRAEVLYNMDSLKASVADVEIARTVHGIVKKNAQSIVVINTKKSAIQLNVETPLPESLQDIPRMDKIPYKHLGFEMKNGRG